MSLGILVKQATKIWHETENFVKNLNFSKTKRHNFGLNLAKKWNENLVYN